MNLLGAGAGGGVGGGAGGRVEGVWVACKCDSLGGTGTYQGGAVPFRLPNKSTPIYGLTPITDTTFVTCMD